MRLLPRLAAGAAVALAAGVALMLTGCSQDGDRAAVTSTSPADGETFARAPTEVGLALTGPVDPIRSHILVTDGSGASLATDAMRQIEPQRLSQPISVPAAGEVTVDYHVILIDGAALTGSWRFIVGSGSSARSDAGQAAPAAGHQHDIDAVSAGLLVADGITVLAVVVLLLRRPRRSAPDRR